MGRGVVVVVEFGMHMSRRDLGPMREDVGACVARRRDDGALTGATKKKEQSTHTLSRFEHRPCAGLQGETCADAPYEWCKTRVVN